MKCQRCQNTDSIYFHKDTTTTYCRKCIQFGRLNVGDTPPITAWKCKKHRCNYSLMFELTNKQLEASQAIVNYLKQGYDVLVYAACGAGKTELTMEPIKNALNQGLKVGFAIARRQVVLEIAQRMQKAFKSLKVVAVCEGYTSDVDGDLIVCTMHQLYRYHATFDLLIMDEVDAFPYRNNEVLEAIAHNSAKGRILYLSATPDDEMLERVAEGNLKMVELFERPHGHPLVYPTLVRLPKMLQVLHFLFFIIKEKQQVLAFVPSIRQAEVYAKLFSLFFRCKALTSKTQNSESIIDELRSGNLDFLFTTTVLERGITIAKIDIVVFQSDHIIFDESSLIQIIGRVGRSPNKPDGLGIFYYTKKTRAIKRCMKALVKMNE